MNIYRIISNTKLHGFGDPISEVPILGKSLDTWQREISSSVGLQLIDIHDGEQILDESYFSFPEDCYFSLAFLQQAYTASNKSQESLEFVLEENVFNQRFLMCSSQDSNRMYSFNFSFVLKKSTLKKKFVIQQTIYNFETRIPKQLIASSFYQVPQCATLAGRIISPFHLLQINVAENLKRTIKLQNGFAGKFFKNLKGRLGSWIFYKGLKRLNKFGKNNLIHPSAIIEGCVIGNNVKIGAGAVVKLSYIGDDVTIADNAVVANSVLGDKTYISNSNYIEMVMTYEEAFLIHGPYQFSIFGRNSAVFAVINCDFRMDMAAIKIPTSQGILDSKQPFLGIAYGHDSKVAGGNIIAAGRIVPNNKVINPPNNIILKF